MNSKYILITGGTGFLGRHFVETLKESGKLAVVLTRFPAKYISEKNDNIIYKQATLESIRSIFEDYEIYAVAHLATSYGKSDSVSETIFCNIILPLELLKLSVKNNVDLFINVDSFFTDYHNTYEYLSDYSTSKYQFKYWAKKLVETENLKFVNLKLFHLYGPGDSQDKFIPRTIISMLNNEPEIWLSKGNQIRDFVFVDDIINVLYELVCLRIEVKDGFSDYDLGSCTGMTIGEIVIKIRQLTNTSSKVSFGRLPERKGEIMYAVAKRNPLNQFLIFTPIDAGLVKTINYYKLLSL